MHVRTCSLAREKVAFPSPVACGVEILPFLSEGKDDGLPLAMFWRG